MEKITSEEWLKKAEEIMDNSTCWQSLEDELLKLYCLFSRCCCSKTENGTEVLSREYVVGKLVRVLSQVPIVLDGDSKRVYATLKMESIQPKTVETNEEKS